MRIRTIERVDAGCRDDSDAIVLEQSFSNRSRRLRSGALTIAGTLLMTPFVLLATADGFTESAFALFTANPVAALQLGFLSLMAVIAIVAGVWGLIQPVPNARTVTLDAAHASVREQFGRKTATWQEPITAFRGMRHRVMTTSEGVLHTLTLEHAQSARSVLIAADRLISSETIAAEAQRFNLPVLTPSSSAGLFHAGRGRLSSLSGLLLQRRGRHPIAGT